MASRHLQFWSVYRQKPSEGLRLWSRGSGDVPLSCLAVYADHRRPTGNHACGANSTTKSPNRTCQAVTASYAVRPKALLALAVGAVKRAVTVPVALRLVATHGGGEPGV